MDDRSFSAILGLLVREEWRNLPAATRATAHRAERAHDYGLVLAAAALNAGEPKRARRILAGMAAVTGDEAAVAMALRHAAEVLDRNWFPGGGAAVLTDEDIAVLTAGPAPRAAGARAALLVTMAASFVGSLPTWRRLVAEDVGRAYALPEAGAVLGQILRAGVPAAVAPVALAVADLYVRAGDPSTGDRLFQLAVEAYGVGNDVIGLAACDLKRGDWAAGANAVPEALGEGLEHQPPTPARNNLYDPAGAESRWAAAEALFSQAGAARGIAVVALRRASRAVDRDAPHEALDLLAQAHNAAHTSGDSALEQLISVHQALARIQAGGRDDPAMLSRAIGMWASGVGSTSYARGLVRLCTARMLRWRDADAPSGRASHRLADALAASTGAPVEAAMLRRELANQYGNMNYRRAALVLTLSELERVRRLETPRTDWAWRTASLQATMACRDANAQRDATLLAEVAQYASWLRATAPDDAIALESAAAQGGSVIPGADAVVAAALDGVLADAAVFVPLYRAIAAQATGDIDSWREHCAAALNVAQSTTPLHEIVVLATLRRFADAYRLVPAVRGMTLPMIAALLVRLRRCEEALAVLARIDSEGDQHVFDEPWARAALWAEALLGAGRPVEALARSHDAIQAVENHLARLSLDVFRTMASDDAVVAGVYTTAVTACTVLAGVDRSRNLARGFELSDRCRGGSLGDLLELDRSTPAGQPVARAARAWQRAGASLAKTVEEVADRITGTAGRPTPEAIQRAVRAAERQLDDAETRLVAVAPDTFAARRRLPPTPSFAEIQQRLSTETLLLQYHAFNDELIGWAVSRRGADVVRQRFDTPALTGHVAAFHRAAADPYSTGGDRHRLAQPLALLLKPFAAWLRAYRRVVFVPHGPLTALPFQLLPFDGAPLAMTHTVSYLPAASFAPDRPGGVDVDGRVVVVGDPAYDPDRQLPRLAGARLEALQVARLYGVTALVDGEATSRAALDQLPSADLVHLATHGTFHLGAPYRTEMALAGQDSLTVPDLFGCGLHVGLMVLSACDSGRGQATAAGDVVGLTRALLGSGVHQLVVSMWPVHDMITCLTMVAFHEALRATPDSVAGALAAAQSRVRALDWAEAFAWYERLGGWADPAVRGRVRRNRDLGSERPVVADPAHPYYWSPFIHVGTA